MNRCRPAQGLLVAALTRRSHGAPASIACWFVLLLLLQAPGSFGQAPVTVEIEALMPNTVVLKINGERKTLRAGQSAAGVTLVGANSRTATLDINGERKELGLHRRVTTRYETPKERQIDIPRNERMQYITTATINGRGVNVIVDTGANIVAMSSVQAAALGVDYRSGQVSTLETASSVINAWVVTLPVVEVGGIRVENVRATIAEGDFPTTVLLGMSYLRHVKMTESDGVLSLSRAW